MNLKKELRRRILNFGVKEKFVVGIDPSHYGPDANVCVSLRFIYTTNLSDWDNLHFRLSYSSFSPHQKEYMPIRDIKRMEGAKFVFIDLACPKQIDKIYKEFCGLRLEKIRFELRELNGGD